MAKSKPKKQNGQFISAEDAKLLEQAKQARKDMTLDLEEFRRLLEEDYIHEYDTKKANIDDEIEKEKEKRRKIFEEELHKTHSDAIDEANRLAEKNKTLEKELDRLEKRAEKIAADQKASEESMQQSAEMIISDANQKAQEVKENADKEAEKILDEAKKAAEKESQKLLADVKQQQAENAKKEEELEDKEMELDARESVLKGRERRVQKQAEVYDSANPEAVAALEKKLEMRAEQLEQVQSEYEKVQRELNTIKIQQIRREGISPEELQKTNDMLASRVEELENKCNRYTEYELSEMQRALDQEENYLVQIKNLSSELSSRKSELERLNNSILEYEQLRAQMDLLRTLNEHLRSELDNTKRMLESNVGEICPALTSIDIEENSDTGKSYVAFQERIDNRNDGRVNTLKELVDHVKTYAAAQQKPLFYSDRDLRAFVAGMAASPMAILQGMSGTGKTSLPKIFSEAIMGEISVVPVESSWRDRNELLGYYNDFSKKFTAKEFTCDLYKAGCKRYEDTIYFIVLDEMNLSRVEYYFADFLSVLEDKKENWKIRLVDTDMRQLPTEITDEVIKELENDKKEKNKEILAIINKIYPNQKLSDEEESSISASDKLRLISYLSERQARIDTPSNCRVGGPQNLIGGNTIQIPRNVWFIGTANRDESTFEITDKVYDRAQVLNFNNRAKGVKLSSDNGRVFITYNELNMMFMKARESELFHFKAEDNELLQKIEQILKNYFRISYGNRIQDQMDIFVPVYVMAGLEDASQKDDKKIDLLINEAIDYQLTNKVLRKLEYEDINKDAAEKLRKLFEAKKLVLATDFLNWKTRGDEV